MKRDKKGQNSFFQKTRMSPKESQKLQDSYLRGTLRMPPTILHEAQNGREYIMTCAWGGGGGGWGSEMTYYTY